MTMKPITPEDHLACVDTIQRFAVFVDAGRYEEAANLFAEDGVMQRPQERIDGRRALMDSFKARPHHRMTRHIISNVVLEPMGPDRVRASSYASVYRHLGPVGAPLTLPVTSRAPETIAEYSDELSRENGEWRIWRRTVRPVFDTP